MRLKIPFSVLAFVCISHTLFAQEPGSITGRVKMNSGKPVPSATILLYKFPDSILLRTAVTDMNGRFEIELVKSDNYFITVSHVGNKKKSTEVFSVNEGRVYDVPEVILQTAQKTLSGITISNLAKPVIEVTADKTVFNVESSINASGSNAFELLQKSPGVVTDKDDNIILKGKSGVRIYIDGRLVQMEAADLAAYLRSINSTDIEAIEMISNPSAKYDAEGNAGIINIRFKKNKKLGFNGSVTAGLGVGINPKTNTGFSFNYRNRKINLYSNYSNAWSRNQINFNMHRIQNDSLYDQKNIQVTDGWSHNLKSGIDFFIAKSQTIGVIVTANINDNTANTSTHTPISSAINGQLGQVLYAKNILPLKVRNYNYNFNYRYLDSIGNEFNFDADYGNYKSRRNSYQPNYYYSPYPEVLQDSNIYWNNTPNNVKILTFKFDFENPFKKSKLGVGIKLGNVRTDNSFDFYDITDGTSIRDLSRSNMFSYRENVNAAYVNYNRILSAKWKVQAGLRLEQTSSKSKLNRANGIAQADDNVDRNYTDLFPAMAITYEANSSHSFNLNYSRRIDRPIYQDLNPFENKLDELTYQKGNAFLKPQYANNIQLSHTLNGRFITSLSYSHVSDFKAQIIDTLEIKRTFISKRNLASQDIVNLNFSLPFQIKKWWNLFANLNLFHSYYKADLGPGKVIDIKVTSGSFNIQNSFTLGYGYSVEVSGYYNAPAVWAGTFRSSSMGVMDMGIQKQLFQKKATVKLSFTDMLNTLRWEGKSNFSGSDIIANAHWESQQVRLNFTYRFGNNQVKQERQRVTGSDEEKKRAESGGQLGGG